MYVHLIKEKNKKFLAIVVFTFIILYVVFEWTIYKKGVILLTKDDRRSDLLQPKYFNSRVDGDTNTRFLPFYNEFADDHIPDTKIKFSEEEIIHICITIGGASAAVEARFLLRSLYIHARRNNLFFHFLVTEDAKKVLKKYIAQLSAPSVNISYEFVKFDADFVKRRAKSVNVSITHHSGVFGMSKSFMYDMLSEVERCLILDTDLVFGTDPAFLWSRFRDLNPPYVGALKLGKNVDEMCSGVVLQKFSKMRKSNFDSLYKGAVPKSCKPIKDKNNSEYFCEFGDQSMIFAVQLQSPIFKDLDDSWSLELCHEFRGHSFHSWEQNDRLFFGIVHFNCLQWRRKLRTIDDYMMKYSKSKLGKYLLLLDKMKN